MDRGGYSEFERALDPVAAQSLSHQCARAGSSDDLCMAGDVVAMRVRDEGARLAKLRIEPEIMRRESDAAMVANGEQGSGW